MKPHRFYSDEEIEAVKDRVEGALKDAEEAAFTLEMFMMDWRKRMAAQRAKVAAE